MKEHIQQPAPATTCKYTDVSTYLLEESWPSTGKKFALRPPEGLVATPPTVKSISESTGKKLWELISQNFHGATWRPLRADFVQGDAPDLVQHLGWQRKTWPIGSLQPCMLRWRCTQNTFTNHLENERPYSCSTLRTGYPLPQVMIEIPRLERRRTLLQTQGPAVLCASHPQTGWVQSRFPICLTKCSLSQGICTAYIYWECQYTNKFIRTALEMHAKYIKIRYHAIYIIYTYIHIRNGPHDVDARAFRHILKYLHWAVLNWETLHSAVPAPGLPCRYTVIIM